MSFLRRPLFPELWRTRRRDRLYATYGTRGIEAVEAARPLTSHFSRHGSGLNVRFALLQLGNLPGGSGDLGFS
jgi:hypothetical protein